MYAKPFIYNIYVFSGNQWYLLEDFDPLPSVEVTDLIRRAWKLVVSNFFAACCTARLAYRLRLCVLSSVSY